MQVRFLVAPVETAGTRRTDGRRVERRKALPLTYGRK
jgi:hypothetical protein